MAAIYFWLGMGILTIALVGMIADRPRRRFWMGVAAAYGLISLVMRMTSGRQFKV